MFINGGTEIYVEQPRNPIHPTNPEIRMNGGTEDYKIQNDAS